MGEQLEGEVFLRLKLPTDEARRNVEQLRQTLGRAAQDAKEMGAAGGGGLRDAVGGLGGGAARLAAGAAFGGGAQAFEATLRGATDRIATAIERAVTAKLGPLAAPAVREFTQRGGDILVEAAARPVVAAEARVAGVAGALGRAGVDISDAQLEGLFARVLEAERRESAGRRRVERMTLPLLAEEALRYFTPR